MAHDRETTEDRWTTTATNTFERALHEGPVRDPQTVD